MYQFVAVAVGAWMGMMWPFIIKLLRDIAPSDALKLVAPVGISGANQPVSEQSQVGKYVVWIVLTLVVAAAVAALNIVPLVVGEQADKLKALGVWQYFFLGTEGFALAAFFNEGIRPK